MRRMQQIGWFLAAFVLVGFTTEALARPKTGVLEKTKVEGHKIKIFTDTVYDYKLTTPVGWEFNPQKEKSDDELKPYRLRMRMKDKQIPAQLWDAQNLVTNCQIFLFIVDVDWDVEEIRDSLVNPKFRADWQKPIEKYCDLYVQGQFLQELNIKWENKWEGAGYTVRKEYNAQISTGGGFTSVTEILLGEFYVFPFKGHKMIVHLISEREFLEENRNQCKEILFQMGELQP